MKTKYAAILLILFSFFKTLQAQVTFEKVYAANVSGSANDVRLTNDGGYIVTGSAVVPGKGSDLFLLKTDANGDTLWTRFIGGTGTDYGNTVCQTADNGYIIAASTNSYGAGALDAWIVKTDASGNLLWSKTFGTASNDEAYGIIQTADGGYVFSGTEKQSNLNGYAHLVKIDDAGNVIWSKTFGSNLRKNFAYTLLQTNDGGFMIGGWENLNLGSNDDMCLIKTDDTGNLQWYKSYGDVGHDQNFSVSQTADGGFIIAGITFSAFIFEANVAKTDSAGNLLWSRYVGGNAEDDAYAVTGTSDGGVAFCGTTSSFGATHLGYLVKLSNTGNVLWSKTMGTSGLTSFYAIQETPDNGLILAGVKNQTGNSGLYLVKTDANGNSGCNASVTSTATQPSILVGTPTAHSTSTQITGTANPGTSSGTDVTTICASCTPLTWYQDADADGYGNLQVTQSSCTQPAGFVSDFADCNDQNASINPGVADVCNGIDDNCNGLIDENAIVALVSPSGTVTACSGTTVVLTANTGTGISYQWFKNNNALAGATNNAYEVKKKGNYFVSESNGFGCNSLSNKVKVVFTPAPDAVITPLGNLDICITGSVDLQANAGAGYTYQWKRNANLLAGATDQLFTATAVGKYRVIVTNAEGCNKTSNAVKVIKSCKESTAFTVGAEEALICYPNPSGGIFFIQYHPDKNETGAIYVELLNDLNQKLFAEMIPNSGNDVNFQIGNTMDLKSGIYVLKITQGNHLVSRKIIIER